MRLLLVALIVVVMGGASPVLAQQRNLDRDCPIPYTAARQQTLAQAYARVTANIATALPIGNLNNPTLEAFYSNVRQIIAGEAIQALSDLDAAYMCRLQASLPEAKRQHLALIFREVTRLTRVSFQANNFVSIQAADALSDYVEARAAAPLPGLEAIPAANRVTAAEIRAILGSPNFRERSTTKLGFEAGLGPATIGGCLGTVRATLATVDNATIDALSARSNVLADMADSAGRERAYNRISTDAQALYQPGTTTQVGAQVAQATNRTQLQTCMRERAETVIAQVQQNAVISMEGSASTATTGTGTGATTGTTGTATGTAGGATTSTPAPAPTPSLVPLPTESNPRTAALTGAPAGARARTIEQRT